MPGGMRSDEARWNAAVLLAGGVPRDKVCEQLGVSRQTLWRWTKEPDFCDAMAELRSEVLQHVTSRLASHVEQAIETLVRAMSSRVVHAEVRAAVALIDLYVKTGEAAELRERISKLEAALAEEEGWR